MTSSLKAMKDMMRLAMSTLSTRQIFAVTVRCAMETSMHASLYQWNENYSLAADDPKKDLGRSTVWGSTVSSYQIWIPCNPWIPRILKNINEIEGCDRF